jgi:hypothetical protein
VSVDARERLAGPAVGGRGTRVDVLDPGRARHAGDRPDRAGAGAALVPDMRVRISVADWLAELPGPPVV